MKVFLPKLLVHTNHADHTEDIYSEVKTAVETALKWAATANDRIIAKDQATMTVANMLFDNIDDASCM